MGDKWRIAWKSKRSGRHGYFGELFDTEKDAIRGMGELNQPYAEVEYFPELVTADMDHEIVQLNPKRRRIAYPTRPRN